MNMIWLILTSLLYISLLIIVYFAKKRFSSYENNFFKILMLLNAIGLLIEIMCFYGVIVQDKYPFFTALVTRGLLVYYLVWILIFTLYICAISYGKEKEEQKFKKYMKRRIIGAILFGIICLPFFIVLPIEYYNDGAKIYSYGKSVDFLNNVFAVLIFVWVLILLTHHQNAKTKQHLPIYVFILMGSIVGIIQRTYPWMLLMTSFQTLVVFLMFFTIENPDLQMLYELRKNRYLIDKTTEDKTNLLFNLSQEVKRPITNINQLCADITNVQNEQELREVIRDLRENAGKLNFVVNDLLDVSDLDSHNIKTVSSIYSLHNLLKSIEVRVKSQLDEKVEFRLIMSSYVPDRIFGDSSKIKQILMSILGNAIKYTKKGFIELRCDAIIKYDACRLIFTIEDSGVGMPIDLVNELLDTDGSMTQEEVERMDEMDLSIKLVGKLTRYIGGHTLIKSDEGKGTEFIVVIEQKIVDDANQVANEKLKTISRQVFHSKRVLLVTDSKDELKEIKRKLVNKGLEVISTMDGKDALIKVRKDDFDLLIIESEMENASGYSIFQELQSLERNVPTIIMINENVRRLGKQYLEDGFKDFIIKDNLDPELERIVQKHL